MKISIDLQDNNFYGTKIYSIDQSPIQMMSMQRDVQVHYKKYAVYILLGPKVINEKRKIYIGQTTNLSRRIREHSREKDFWTEFIAFYSTNNFTKTEIEWLEMTLIKSVINCNHYDIIKNYQIPKNINIKASDELELIETFDTIKLLLNVYGFPIINQNYEYSDSSNNRQSQDIITRIAKSYLNLSATLDQDYQEDDDKDAFTIEHDDIKAYGVNLPNGKIYLMAGSTINPEFISEKRNSILKKYTDRIENNKIIKDFTVDNLKVAKLIIG